jgi:hypothetical protein
LAHLSNEPEALARQRPDEALRFARVTDCSPDRINSSAQRRFRDDPPSPNRSEQVVLRDDAISVAYEEDEQIEDLWFERHDIRAAPQFPPLRV